MLIPKIKRLRSSKHLNFIRKLPCVVCGTKENVQACHIRIGGNGGMGLKPDDSLTIPMCHLHHTCQHNKGELSFWGDIEKPKNLAKFLYENTGDLMTCFLAVKRFK